MKLLGFNINISRQTAKAGPGEVPAMVQKYLAASPEAWLRGEDLDGGPSVTNAYEQVVWVYRAINVLAEQVANVPFLFSAGERGRENLITSGPLLDFYNRLHPQIDRFQYWELRVMWLMLRGECFRVPIYEDGRPAAFKNRESKLKQVLILDPARFQHVIEDHQLIGWRYTGLGPQTPLASQVFLPEEVWFEKLPNPFDFWRGFSPLYVAGTAAQADFAAGAFMRGVIENNGDTGVMVRSSEWLSPEQQEQIVAALRDRKRRAGVADRPVLLLGTAEVIKPQLSSSDLQFLENRKFSRAEICAAFGVPEEIVTTTEHSKYDVMAGARLNFIENRVGPLCSRLEAAEQASVRTLDANASGWFDLESLPILQEARRTRLAAARAGFEMGVPFNELNRVFDLGFKPLPWGNRGYVASKLTEVGTEGAHPDRGSVRSTTRSSPEAATRDEFSSPHAKVAAAAGPSDTAAVRDPLGRASEWLAHASVCRIQPAQPQLLRRLRRFFFEQRGRVLARLAAEKGNTTAASAPSLPSANVRASTSPVADIPASGANAFTPIPDLAAEDERLLALVQPVLEPQRVGTRSTASASGMEVGGPGGTGPYPTAAVRAAVKELNRATASALEQALEAAAAQGQTAEQIASRVRAVFNETARQAPELARRVNNAGNFATSDQTNPGIANAPEKLSQPTRL